MKSTNAILDRLMDPVVRTLTPEVAKAIVELRADPKLQERMDELAEKCNEGKLTTDEREEYETKHPIRQLYRNHPGKGATIDFGAPTVRKQFSPGQSAAPPWVNIP